ncbi:MAG: CbiX protein [Acidobacteriaceae bacterium]|nr:CbiX protein [Acidobacteriaceae bacterium]
MKKLLLALLLPYFAVSVRAQTPKPITKTGILLLAHGGSAQAWNEEVRHVADQVDLSVPIEVAFGMATKSSMQTGIDRLTTRGVTQIIVVPLFVSSHSSVIDSTAYLLGLRTEMPEDLKMFAAMDHGSSPKGGMQHDHAATPDPAQAASAMKPIAATVPVRMAPALDHHRVVADILTDRAASISHDPAHETIILIAHGPVPDDENKLWLADMSALAKEMRAKTHYADIAYMTLRDDADDPIRDAATKELRERIEAITKKGNKALIVPLLLSYGGIESGLRKRLDGLTYTMASQGLLPDHRIASWVLESEAATAATPSR